MTGLKEEDFQLILKQFNSKFLTCKAFPGVYTFKDLSEIVSRGLKKEFEIRERMRPNPKKVRSDSFIIESDNVTLIKKLNVNPEVPQVHALRFNRNSFLNTILAFSQFCDFEVEIMKCVVKKIEI